MLPAYFIISVPSCIALPKSPARHIFAKFSTDISAKFLVSFELIKEMKFGTILSNIDIVPLLPLLLYNEVSFFPRLLPNSIVPNYNRSPHIGQNLIGIPISKISSTLP